MIKIVNFPGSILFYNAKNLALMNPEKKRTKKKIRDETLLM